MNDDLGRSSEFNKGLTDAPALAGAELSGAAAGAAAALPPRSDAADAASAAASESIREEDRARLEAFAAQKRQDALLRYPELKRAYDLQDASNAFRHQHISDPASSADFQKLTDDFIRQKLRRGEVLPEIKRLDQEQENLLTEQRNRALSLESARTRDLERER